MLALGFIPATDLVTSLHAEFEYALDRLGAAVALLVTAPLSAGMRSPSSCAARGRCSCGANGSGNTAAP